MTISRRGLLCGLASALAAPAIVRIDNIMPVRNRLIVPTKSLFIPMPGDPVYTFSCYLKPPGPGPDISLFQAPQDGHWAAVSEAGNGWYRYSTTFQSKDGESVKIILPTETCWGAQLEWKGGANAGVDLSLSGPSGEGAYVLPTFEKDWST